MKILVGLTHPQKPGGIHITETRFVEECRRQDGMMVMTFTFGSKPGAEAIGARIFDRLLDVVKFAILLVQFRPDITHINSAFDKRAAFRDVWYGIVAKLFRRHLFIKFHGSDAGLVATPSHFWRILTKIILGCASRVGLLSSEERTNFITAGHPAELFYVVRNVVDVGRFSGEQKVSRLHSDILFIARFIPAKGLLDAIRAIDLVLRERVPVRLICVGDGPQRCEAEELVRDLGLGEAVLFTGFLPEDETIPFYLSSTVLVLPTYHQEGFPMTIFQALAAGLPVITTRIRAAADYLLEPDHCLWVEPRNPQMLRDKILSLLNDPGLREAMAQNNRILVRQFTARQVVPEYLKIYKSIIGAEG